MSHDDVFVGEVRYSREMRLLRGFTMGLGVSLSVGVLLLLGPGAHWMGPREPLAYLLAGLLFLPAALSLAELSAASGSQGVYRLIQAMDRQPLTYLTGWALLGGGIVLGGMLAQGAANYLSVLAASLVDLRIDPRWLGLAIVLILTLNNVLGSRENRGPHLHKSYARQPGRPSNTIKSRVAQWCA
jgi:amino acid transporter